MWRGTDCSRRFQADLCHLFFQWLARILIFLTWLLLGMPMVTTTSLSETNIRQAFDADVTTVEV